MTHFMAGDGVSQPHHAEIDKPMPVLTNQGSHSSSWCMATARRGVTGNVAVVVAVVAPDAILLVSQSFAFNAVLIDLLRHCAEIEDVA